MVTNRASSRMTSMGLPSGPYSILGYLLDPGIPSPFTRLFVSSSPFLHQVYASFSKHTITYVPSEFCVWLFSPTTKAHSERSTSSENIMANANDMTSSRPGYHGYGPSINGPVASNPPFPVIYEGYLFIPSEHSLFEDRWTRARPMKLPVSQDDLYDQVVKQRKSGNTATEELCGLRVDNAKRAMIYKLIHERSMSESGSTYELVALRLERDYVRDEKPETGKNYNRKYDSKHKTSKRRRKRTVSVYIVLQRPVKRTSDVPLANALNSSGKFPGANTISSNSHPSQEFVAMTAPNTPRNTPRLEYVPSYARPRDSNGNDNHSDTQSVNGRDNWEGRYHRRPSIPPPIHCGDGKLDFRGPPTSFSTRSSDTAKPTTTTPRTPAVTSHYNGYFPAQDLNRKSLAQNESYHRPVDTWSEHSTRTRPTTHGVSRNDGKQQPSLQTQPQTVYPVCSFPPYISKSGESQANVAVVHSFEDGRRENVHDFRGHTRGLGSDEEARQADVQSLSSVSTSEDDSTSMTPSLDGDDSLHGSHQPKADGRNVCEQKPAWMDNLVPGLSPLAVRS